MVKKNSIQQKLIGRLRLERAIKLVWKSSPRWTILSVANIFILGLLPLLSLYLTKLVIDSVTIAISSTDKAVYVRNILILIGLLCLTNLASIFLGSIGKLIAMKQSQEVTTYVQDIVHAKSVEVDLEYYENSTYYDTLQRAQQEASSRPTGVVNKLVQLGSNGITLISIGWLIIYLNFWIGVVLLISVIPSIIVRLKYSDVEYRLQLRTTQLERRSNYLNWLITGGFHAKELRLFDLGELLRHLFTDLRNQLFDERFEIAKRRNIEESFSSACTILAMYGSFAFFAYKTVLGAITLGSLVMYFQAFQRAQGSLQSIISSLNGLYDDNLFLSNFYEFLDLKQNVPEPADPVPFPDKVQNGVHFENVSFRYPGSEKNALMNINLKIPTGKIVALVGENGSGKTTLIKLLCRLYDPTVGSISVDGIDLRQFQLSKLRNKISIIFQDYSHYNMTARENIWIGDISLIKEHERIIEASQLSGADDVINGLKYGYETELGKWFGEGEELSTGEWQKVALARAFLRDSKIIVLDEPTSSIDPIAEDRIFKNIRELAAGRCIIIISHRLSIARNTDRIYVMKEGKISESGTHEDLVNNASDYAAMFKAQSRNYL
jgi:ATP-binding cassette, subfamily B, bacterial